MCFKPRDRASSAERLAPWRPCHRSPGTPACLHPRAVPGPGEPGQSGAREGLLPELERIAAQNTMETLPGIGPGDKLFSPEPSSPLLLSDQHCVEFHLPHWKSPPLNLRDPLWFLISCFSKCPARSIPTPELVRDGPVLWASPWADPSAARSPECGAKRRLSLNLPVSGTSHRGSLLWSSQEPTPERALPSLSLCWCFARGIWSFPRQAEERGPVPSSWGPPAALLQGAPAATATCLGGMGQVS